MAPCISMMCMLIFLFSKVLTFNIDRIMDINIVKVGNEKSEAELANEAVIEILEIVWTQLRLDQRDLNRTLPQLKSTIKDPPKIVGFVGKSKTIILTLFNVNEDCILIFKDKSKCIFFEMGYMC